MKTLGRASLSSVHTQLVWLVEWQRMPLKHSQCNIPVCSEELQWATKVQAPVIGVYLAKLGLCRAQSRPQLFSQLCITSNCL